MWANGLPQEMELASGCFSTKSLCMYSTTLSSKMHKDAVYLCISIMCLLVCTGGIYLPRGRKTGKSQPSSSASPHGTEVIADPRTFGKDSFSVLETPVVLIF